MCRLSKSDFYTINTRYKSELADLVELRNDSVQAMDELKYLIGLKYNSSFNVKEIDSAEITNIVTKEINLSEVLDKVLKNHPALLESIYAEKSAEMNLKTARGNLIPSVSLTGNIFSNYNLTDKSLSGSHIAFHRQLNENFGKTAGILLEIPLFNRLQNRFAVEREKINLSNAKLATEQVQNDIVKNMQQLLTEFISAKQKYQLQTEALQQGELAYEALKSGTNWVTFLRLNWFWLKINYMQSK